MTKLMTTPRLAALAAMSLASGTIVDLCAAASTRRHVNFGTNDSSANLLNIKADVSTHAGGAGNMAALTTAQVETDIAGAAKKVRTAEITILGSSANGTCIGIDGVGSASAPAVKTATCIGSGEALGVSCDEAGVDFGASCEGMAPMALVSAAAKKAFGSARRLI